MAKQSYHFDIGDSFSGPLGLCARVIAGSEEEAVQILRDRMEEVMGEFNDIAIHGAIGNFPAEYITLYLNPEAVTVANIDEVDDLEEQ